MARARALDHGRESLGKRQWGEAFAHLSAADRETPLAPLELEALATAAHLLGKEEEGREILSRAHQSFLNDGNTPRAARCAIWLGFGLLNNGELAQAGGWLARARRLLDECGQDCVENGLLLVPVGIRAFHEGDPAAAYAAFVDAAAIGERFANRDVVTLARHGQGRALIRQGETARGVSLLDEAMVAVMAGDVSPLVSGGVYCSVIEACGEIFDLRRAQEWTAALDRWCALQPDMVPFRGHCLVRRAEILQVHGSWPAALREAQRAREQLSQPVPRPAIGAALYRMGELYRLRGEFVEAEEAYREAGRWARIPQPGVALLRLAQGRIDAAYTAIRHVVDELHETAHRAPVLDAYVQIALAANHVAEARAAADELLEIASRLHAPLLDAMSARAAGAVCLAEGDARAAVNSLRQAMSAWRELDAPHEEARARVLIALAYQAQGNAEAADLELEAARGVFEQLGAVPDLARLEELSRKSKATAEGPLTAREIEVLRLVACGMTNRGIAEKLVISEKTVARHLSNIFTKLDLTSRAAATAYAYQNGLGQPSST